MKKSFSVFLLLITWGFLSAAETNTLGIDSCMAMAVRNYPLSKQRRLLEKALSYNLENISRGYLPQVSVSGSATWQSDVTKIPFSLPNMQVNALSKDQYRTYAELNQPLTDMFILQDQKKQSSQLSALESQKNEVEVYAIKERVAQLFFGILLLQEQLNQQSLLEKDFEVQISRMKASVVSGTALQSQVWQLEAESINCSQKTTELKAGLNSYRMMLSAFVNAGIDEKTALEIPVIAESFSGNNRPELRLFELQSGLIPLQEQLLRNKNLPRINLFMQGGYGRPALNMLNNDFASYFIGGLRFSWNLTGFYTYKQERSLLDLNKEMIEVQRNVFLFNNRLRETQLTGEREKNRLLMQSDEELLRLRTQIKNTTALQVESGTATASDLILSINAEDKARTARLFHKMQLLLNQYTIKINSGN